ncbi:MAG TPA: rhamnan synthesis F family protein [Aliidongia sp.]|uniref:rhamnan synthesis F family protein n=1 Tax=Aliidongia sp. TaxID=1914230 RepID=UPI002DDCA6CE|nr:rhamnan synthesis F family protein [Aliidongia sp.]HEV2676084.1 rhamnan synthesis F family protein [Aliidongia sp.]
MVQRVWQSLYNPVADRVSWYTSWRHSKPDYVRQRWEGQSGIRPSGKIAVLVHFSTNGRFAGYFLYLLRALEEAGFSTVIVSNARQIDRDSLETVLPHCARVLHRDNIGYDFGAWRDGISLTPEIAGAEQLLLVNDSIFGPLQNIPEILGRCDFDKADIWGMTDSFSGKYHLQSYFVLVGSKALRSKIFTDFWQRLRYVSSKRVVIYKYEIGLSQAMLRGGLRLRALFPYRTLTKAVFDCALVGPPKGVHPLRDEYFDRLFRSVNAGHPLNPTHYFWEYLITDLEFPFLKRELVEKNPAGVPLLSGWRSTIEQSSDYPVDLIEEYLQSTAKDRVF